MSRKHIVKLTLPPEFIRLCERDRVEPEEVLRGFIADLCELGVWPGNPKRAGYANHGSEESRYAQDYYDRVGYPWWHRGLSEPSKPGKDPA